MIGFRYTFSIYILTLKFSEPSNTCYAHMVVIFQPNIYQVEQNMRSSCKNCRHPRTPLLSCAFYFRLKNANNISYSPNMKPLKHFVVFFRKRSDDQWESVLLKRLFMTRKERQIFFDTKKSLLWTVGSMYYDQMRKTILRN
jgi:hypothetical protein